MAELAAMSVASCVLQIIDFGTKVIKTTYVLVSASQDALREEIHLSKLVHEQDAIAQRLHVSISSRSHLSDNEKAAVDISGRVRAEATELLNVLAQFKMASIGQSRFKKVVENTGTAIRIIRKRKEVENRRMELQRASEQLARAIVSVVGDQNEQMKLDIQTLQRASESNAQDVLAAIMSTRNELIQLFAGYEQKRQRHLWNIILGIGFADMQSRERSVPIAHHGTYDWALAQDINGLATWLRGGSGIFWVTGKAGSGKSTFMKFLGNEERTKKLLSEWVGDQASLIVVNCYFWFLGSCLQKSVEGLLRTILFQILSANPGVVEILFPSRWAREMSGSKEPHNTWTMEELSSALENVRGLIVQTMRGSLPRKVCLFIDGLDEYSGDHGELIHTLQTFVKDGNTKLCASSRPWNVFANAFGNHIPHLFLHELTKGDIRLFVESMLGIQIASSITSHCPKSSDEHLASLANDIVTRAEGVFLWVHLVVLSVVRGLREGDDPMVLEERVIEFPTDLGSFFDTILDRVESVYHHQTAQALMLAYLYAEGHAAAAANSSYLDFELLLRQHAGLHNSQYLWTMEPQKMTCDQLMKMAKRTQEKLSASCKDLLLLVMPRSPVHSQACAEDPSGLTVQFLHRTVFEYLKSSGRMRTLQRKVPPCFHDESVFHLLNMGKLKLAWERKPRERSEYFLRQVAFSLDRGWPGLNVDYINQLQQCQPLHQSDLCASIAAAYVAFEQFDTFQRNYTTSSSQQLIAQFGAEQRRFANKLKKSAQRTWNLRSLLAASLGISECRTFPSSNVKTLTLASILGTMPEDESEEIIRDFFNSALPPILEACEIASTNPDSWNEWFDSDTMHHMYDLTQTLRYSGHAPKHVLRSLPWPMSCHSHLDVTWDYLTTRSEAWERKHGLLGFATMSSADYQAIAQHFTCASSTKGKPTSVKVSNCSGIQCTDGEREMHDRPELQVQHGSFSLVPAQNSDILELRQFVSHMKGLQENLVGSEIPGQQHDLQ